MNTKHTTKNSTLVSVCALALITQASFADQIWVQRYDGPGHRDDRAFAIAVDSAGNAAVTGGSLAAPGHAVRWQPAQRLDSDQVTQWESHWNF